MRTRSPPIFFFFPARSDGSDELPAPGAAAPAHPKCANTCEEDGASWRAAQAEAIRKSEEGALRRQAYVTEHAEAARARAAKLADVNARTAALKADREAAERAVETEEAAERAETERRAAAATPAPAAAAAAAPAAASSGEELEAPPPEAPSLEAQARSLGLAGADKDLLLQLLLEHCVATSSGAALLERLRRWAADGSLPGVAAAGFAPRILEPGDAGGADAGAAAAATAPEPYKSEAGERARAALAQARAAESGVSGELGDLKAQEAMDFGPDGAFYHFKAPGAACLELRQAQYNYKVCPFGSATQDGTSLGSFTGWKKKADGVADYSTMLLESGAHCWNGPARSIALKFECGGADALISVDEPSKCAYEARVSTPAACDGRAAQELQLHELEPEL